MRDTDVREAFGTTDALLGADMWRVEHVYRGARPRPDGVEQVFFVDVLTNPFRGLRVVVSDQDRRPVADVTTNGGDGLEGVLARVPWAELDAAHAPAAGEAVARKATR